MIDDSLAHAYLERLGVDVEPGEVDVRSLAALQRAHLEAVPYENLDIVLGRPPGIDPAGCVERVVAGRGGYCYHLNGAFAALLEWLRVDVTRHVSGVWGRRMEAAPGANGNHMGLTVRVEDGEWLVDVGTGDGPAEPLPLAVGTREQDGRTFRLERSPLAAGGWRLHNDPRGGWHLFDLAPATASTADFAAMHEVLSTSPDSGFVRVATVQRRVGRRTEVLRGCMLTRVGDDGAEETEITSARGWWEVVTDGFGLACGTLSADDRSRLWRHVRAVHEAWDAAGRP